MLVIAIAPMLWAKGAVALLALAATLPALRLLAEPLRKLLTGDTPEVDVDLLLGRIGFTDVGEVRQNFGRALVPVGGYEHSVEVRCREGVISPRHTRVLLQEFNPEGHYFWVNRVDED